MFFHLEAGAHENFERGFRQRFGDAFYLLATEEVEDADLLGPSPLAEETRLRIGAYTAVAKGDEVIIYGRPDDGFALNSAHSGLSREEMEVPLVIA